MEHLFKCLLLLPYFYFSGLKRPTEMVNFSNFYYFTGFYPPLFSFSLTWTVVSVLVFNIVLRNVTDQVLGHLVSFILLAIGLNWLTCSCFKKMFLKRRELGKSGEAAEKRTKTRCA